MAPISAFGSPKARSLALVLLAAFILQAILLFVAIPALSDVLSVRYGIGFADDYDLLAHNLATGIGYRFGSSMAETMMREPGYPLFLSGVFRVLGYHIEAARLANLLLAFGIAVMLMRLARSLSEDGLIPIVAALLFLFHPGTLIAEARGGVEIFFIFILMAFMLALHRAIERGNFRDYFVAGAVLGLVVLVRSTPLLFPVFLFTYLIAFARSVREGVRIAINIAALVLGTMLVMSPWVIRNYALVHEFVPTASVQAVAAQEGQYTCERLSFDRGFEELQTEAAGERNALAEKLGFAFRGGYYQYFYATKDEFAFNQALGSRVMAIYREYPILFGKCVAANLVKFWFLGKTWQVTWVNVLIQLPFLVMTVAGAYVLWRRGLARRIGIIAMFIAYTVLVHATVIAHTRHSIPLVPFLAILASIALVAFWRFRSRKGGTGKLAGGASAALGELQILVTPGGRKP